MEKHPFKVEAICLLPDHLHCIWKLPPDDYDYPKRWRLIKAKFSRLYLKAGGEEGFRNDSRNMKKERAIWQRRYWEHTIKDEEDFARHFDYIHYNPVKHGYVKKAADWKWSSFHRYLRLGYFDEDWGFCDTVAGKHSFGE